jgi:ATP-dependent DNA helicase Rep
VIPCEPSRFIAEMGTDDIRFSGGRQAPEADKAAGSARLDALKAMLAGNRG